MNKRLAVYTYAWVLFLVMIALYGCYLAMN